MRIALLAPLPPAQNGIADYAQQWRTAMEEQGVEVLTPLQGTSTAMSWQETLHAFDWSTIDLVHAELGGGREQEFLALEQLRYNAASPLLLSATVHDPERLIWRSPEDTPMQRVVAGLPRPMPQLAALAGNRRLLKRESKLARNLDRLVTLTHLGAEALGERMRLPPSKLAVIPHGNMSMEFKPLPTLHPLRLLYFGFIYPGKGIEDLLDALCRCFAAEPGLRSRIHLTLAGGSQPQLAFGGNRDYLDRLRKQVRDLQLEDALDWQLDLPTSALPELIHHHHALVLPYKESRRLALLGRMRGTSGVLSWANACGRGVIASDARAFPEEISYGNGQIYAQGDVGALAQCLAVLARDPGRCVTWAERAAQLGHERRWSTVGMRFRILFESLLEGSRHDR